MTDLTPDEVEVGRRNLIAELKDAARSEELGATHNVVLLPQAVADLIAVLEALKLVVVDRTVVKDVLWEHQVGRHLPSAEALDGYRSVIADAVLAALYPKATEGKS